ncbi:hypothetical protein SAMN05519103_00918 [Rhizobiales bacterium GAS113]|jgi:hypothetical protein|nr:hypothetical protein SAMN05519103_00918 [Rhizobiales bacterium GAS113]
MTIKTLLAALALASLPLAVPGVKAEQGEASRLASVISQPAWAGDGTQIAIDHLPGEHHPFFAYFRGRAGFAYRGGYGRRGFAYRGAGVGRYGGRYAYRGGVAVGPRGAVAWRGGAVAFRRPVLVGGIYRPYGAYWGAGGAIAAGAAIGFVTAATAAAWAGAPPSPGYCWYYTDASRTRGFWDVCPQ